MIWCEKYFYSIPIPGFGNAPRSDQKLDFITDYFYNNLQAGLDIAQQ